MAALRREVRSLCRAATLAAAVALVALVAPAPAWQVLSSRAHGRTARAAQGFGVEEKREAKLKEAIEKEVEKPAIMLEGPLRAPDAPASYKALTKIRLRTAPHRFADLRTDYEIEKDETIRVLEAKQDDEGVVFLRTDSDAGDGWFCDRGVVGEFRGRRIVKRIPGSLRLGKKGQALHQISSMKAEDAQAVAKTEGASQSVTSQDTEDSIKSFLEDEEVQKLIQELGISSDTLKNNPAFLKAVAAQLYGEAKDEEDETA
eukprot:TRINITY_DN48807_c0_g1_i1.p1 TRINITY_DN48807_c0_g1~~TRINITY_DN48807_c0_g1_i1.p1  ORF type:complete len:259 (+),score=76.29 TRINITY_DN48807_c0_g1_i1:63-839(+)